MPPADRTEGVVEFLREHVGVAHLAVLPGCAVKPAGDLVLADIARESADEIVQALRERDIDRVGAISLDSIDTSVSTLVERGGERAR